MDAYEFDRACLLERVDSAGEVDRINQFAQRRTGSETEAPAKDGYKVPLHSIWKGDAVDGFTVGQVMNGGWMVATAYGLLQNLFRGQDYTTTSLTCHFIDKCTPGPFRIAATEVKKGLRLAVVELKWYQQERLCSTLWCALQPSMHAVDVDPSRSPPHRYPRTSPTPSLLCKEKIRLHSRTVLLMADAVHQKGNEYCMEGLIRFSDGRPIDAHALVFFADGAIPPVLAVMGSGKAWIASVTLQINVYGPPADPSQSIQYLFTTRILNHNRCEIDGYLYDVTSQKLLVSSRQLALVLPFSATSKKPSMSTL